jgi:LuxR family transcriptional regulator, maltose regulon positive regulatory protein
VLTPLLATKLYIPPARPNRVPRPRLIEQLNILRPLTLVAAPAGFGKTALLSDWIPKSKHCVTWLSLDADDNDPVRFWTYVITAVQRLRADLGESALTLLQSPQPPPITSILSALINEISSFPEDFFIVLDDYHLIKSQPIDEALSFLLDHLPPQMRAILISRADPPLPLARLRARNQLTELRADDLRFTTDEAAVFLNEVMGLKLTAENIAALESRTEGWIAGLQLAALSMQGRDDITSFIQAFSGSHRHVLTYLAEEVLEQRPKGTMNFLLQTSILDRLCGPLCDAVTEQHDGEETLKKLEQANLFIVPLDDEGKWFRYHQLFADVLRARLQQTQPNLIPELHRRAGIWHARQGRIDEAVLHALAGADFDEAARLIESLAGNMLRRGGSISLIRWLDAIPEATVRAHPRLCLARGWTYIIGPVTNLESAEDWVQLALQAAQAEGSLDPGLIGEVTALQAMIAAIWGEVTRSLELSRQSLDSLPLDSPWYSVMTFCLGTALFLSGDLAAAHVLEEAFRLSQADGSRYIQLNAASFLADIQVFLGHLGRAMQMYQEVLAWADDGLPQKGVVMAHAGMADILCERNQLEAALAHINLGTEQLNQVGGAWAALVLCRVLARVQLAQCSWDDALDALDRAYEIGQSTGVSIVMTQIAALRARLQVIQGDLEAAATWAATSGLRPDDPEASHPGLRDVEYLSLARVLDDQGRHEEALSLLERLLKSAEAEGRIGSAIAILVLQSLVFQRQDNTAGALECLERALTLAEPEGYVRIFVDEGEPMKKEIGNLRIEIGKRKDVIGLQTRLMAYTDKLLGAFGSNASELPIAYEQANQPGHQTALVDPLSTRELEVLHLIADGLSNDAIAQKLFLATSTVKVHIKHIYGKLSVGSRTQAIARLRESNLR